MAGEFDLPAFFWGVDVVLSVWFWNGFEGGTLR